MGISWERVAQLRNGEKQLKCLPMLIPADEGKGEFFEVKGTLRQVQLMKNQYLMGQTSALLVICLQFLDIEITNTCGKTKNLKGNLIARIELLSNESDIGSTTATNASLKEAIVKRLNMSSREASSDD